MKLIIALAAVLTSAALTVPTVADVQGETNVQIAERSDLRAARA